MAEFIDSESNLESTTVGVYRTSATVKGGRRFSFSSLVVVGDRNGRVGMGYGKANQVPPAIEKAQKEAKRKLRRFPMVGRTLPHAVTGTFGACRVRLLPASPGTGVIAGAAVRAPLEMMGIQDCLTKSYGSNNPKNLVKAVLDGLRRLRSKELVAELRGVELASTDVEDTIHRTEAFLAKAAPARPAAKAAAAPAPRAAEGRGKGRGKGQKTRRKGKPAEAKPAETKPAETKPAESKAAESKAAEGGAE